MDALLLAVLEEFGRRAVGVEFDLVHRRDGLACWIVQELLEVADGEIGDADVCGPTSAMAHLFVCAIEIQRTLDSARRRQLLHLSPGLDKVPIGQVLLLIIRVC